jgi:hypothetical protein
LFDVLGGNPNAAGAAASQPQQPEALISFKAGKCEMKLQDDGKYYVTADTRRGQVNLRYNTDNALTWEWFDRREQQVVDTVVLKEDQPLKLQRAAVPTPDVDKVYFYKLEDEYKLIWLQDKDVDPELISKVNDILSKPKKPVEETTSTSATNNAGGVSAPSPGNASTSSASTTTRQVDALSNILENLGMPQQQQGAAGTGTAAGGGTAGQQQQLTLADLQGVMAGLQQQAAAAAPAASLADVVTPQAITDLLADEAVRDRLLQELPEEQRTVEHLEENLRSPQVQQTLRSLTAALQPDDAGSMEGYHSVLANFNMDANAGHATLTQTNNPIEAFLECVLASVQKEGEESKDEEMKDGEADAEA